MKIQLILAVLASFSACCRGQGTLQIGFDGAPVQPPATAYSVQEYRESGMIFWSPSGNGFTRVGPGLTARPQNGTAYLAGALPFSLTFNFVDNSLFDIVSVDLAGYSTVVPDVTAYFVGYRSDGSIVRINFTPSGIVFDTYSFGPEFSGLVRVEMPDFGSLDNLVVSIPEPTAGALLAVALALAALKHQRQNNAKFCVNAQD